MNSAKAYLAIQVHFWVILAVPPTLYLYVLLVSNWNIVMRRLPESASLNPLITRMFLHDLDSNAYQAYKVSWQSNQKSDKPRESNNATRKLHIILVFGRARQKFLLSMNS